ncbi:hypothetical protein SLEP1_g7888 [Rubroshorea leprosula]|uniref:Uncharacterized protein n=1 Tax=Rubroshorea leprosula TaxID=152421 RepID=A0AAV5HZT7_9ROSI|nr:hypothetical protein SLEP1_g7888 [Rubroshorea leprosula]
MELGCWRRSWAAGHGARLLETELGCWRRSWAAGHGAGLLDTELGCWRRSWVAGDRAGSATGDEARLLETGEQSLATGDDARLLETGEEKQDARSSLAAPVHQVQDLGRQFTKHEGGAATAARPAPPMKRVGSEGKAMFANDVVEDGEAFTGISDVAPPPTVVHTSSAHVVPFKLTVCKSTGGKASRRQLVTEIALLLLMEFCVDASTPGGCGDNSEPIPPILALDDSGDGNEPVPPPAEESLIADIDASRLIAPKAFNLIRLERKSRE